MKMNENWMKKHFVSDYSNCNIENVQCFECFHKEWQIMLGSNLVLVTLHMQFIVILEQDE